MVRRRHVLGVGVAAGLILTAGSSAFACTVYRGKITGSGNGTGNVAKTVTGNPNGVGAYQWCENPPAFGAGSTETQKRAFWTTTVSPGSIKSLTITVNPATDCLVNGVNKLPVAEAGKAYKVGLSNSYWDESGAGYATGEEDNCHTLLSRSGTGYGVIIDHSFPVDSTGYGTKTYTGSALADVANSATISQGWNTICVFLPAGDQVGKNDAYFNPANALNFKMI